MAVAIRIRGLGRYFGPRVEFDGAARPREAWRTLLRIAGINLKEFTDDNTQRTMAEAGHVLRDISLDIEWGSTVCLMGPSGAGKSVLLQVLGGALPPTAGTAEIYGTMTTLLTANGRLDAVASAAENIRTSDSARGLTPDEAAAFASDVIAFAELEGFENAAVRTFSSGMQLRLNVALALCGRPSIVLVDDVLAVGDIAFQQKCMDRLHALKAQGCTIVAALSDEDEVRQLATRVVTLSSGRIVGDTNTGQAAHAPKEGHAADVDWQLVDDLPEDDVMALRTIAVDAGRIEERSHVDVTLSFEAKVGGVRCRPSVFLNRGKITLFRSLAPAFVDVTGPRRLVWTVRIPSQVLPGGTYTLMINMQTLRGHIAYAMKAHDAVTLTVRREESVPEGAPALPLLAVDFPWEIEAIEAVA
jgi:ABC-type polysaccharide/polyol phosphate transport system ATPase subunit